MHSDAVTTKVAYTLYLCHLLSTWNAKMYEFAAVVFTAVAFPENLIASSIFGMAMKAFVLVFSSILGTWVDQGESRLTTLVSTITANRISVIAACVCWFFIVGLKDLGTQPASTETIDSSGGGPTEGSSGITRGLRNSLFAIVILLSVVERLSRTANLFSIERDWVPTMVPPESPSKADEPPPKFGLTELNAGMSRIDLICKLLSPIVISAFISAAGSVRIGIIAMLILNGLTWSAEIWTARSVWKSSDRLQKSKRLSINEQSNETDSLHSSSPRRFDKPTRSATGPWWRRRGQQAYKAFEVTARGIAAWFQDYRINMRIYFGNAVWLPSMALSILHFSVLNYSATLTVYMLSAGFSLNFITIAKVLSAGAELSSTFFTPWCVRRMERLFARREIAASGGSVFSFPSIGEDSTLLLEREQDNEEDEENGKFAPQVDMGLAMLGLWSLIQMVTSLIPACLALWILSFASRSSSSEKPPPSTFVIVVLITTIPFSRFGRWTNHLVTQQLTQTLVPAYNRSAFVAVEMGLVSLFGLAHWVGTAIWSQHGQFRWLALGSLAAVGCSAGIYYLWLKAESREGRGRITFARIPTSDPS